MPDYNVVLMARVDDMKTFSTVETRSTIVQVDAHPMESPDQIAEMALELAPAIKDWTRT